MAPKNVIHVVSSNARKAGLNRFLEACFANYSSFQILTCAFHSTKNWVSLERKKKCDTWMFSQIIRYYQLGTWFGHPTTPPSKLLCTSIMWCDILPNHLYKIKPHQFQVTHHCWERERENYCIRAYFSSIQHRYLATYRFVANSSQMISSRLSWSL